MTIQIISNIEWFIPEIFLMTSLIALLTYGIINKNSSGIWRFQNYINNFSILILLITMFLLLVIKTLVSDSIFISGGLLQINNLIISIKLVVLITGILILSLNNKLKIFEFSIIILLAILGLLILISASDLIILYLGIELLSLSFYILAAIKRSGELSTEAGLKYFIIGAVSSGLFLLGCGILYSITGHTGYFELEQILLYEKTFNIGEILIIISLLLKIAAAPFHMWAPDVYEGSPTIVTALFAIIPKIAVLFALVIILTGPLLSNFSQLQNILILSAILSLLVGSLGALNQLKFKRLLAYSAIGHIGWILIGIATGSLSGILSAFIYFILYIVMSLITFSIVLYIYPTTANPITQLIGLSRINPTLAITLALTLLSIAGIPPLAGFLSKFLILISAIQTQLWLLTLLAILASVVSAFYYLQLIKLMYFKESDNLIYKLLSEISYKPQEAMPLSYSLIIGGSFWIVLTALIYPIPLYLISNETILLALI